MSFPDSDKIAPAESPVLAVDNLTVSFQREGRWAPVIRDVSFSVRQRETIAIVGESGSGKSVTALSIMRLLPKRASRVEGSIRLDGKELLSLTEQQMREVRGNSIGIIFQEPMTSLNPVLTVGFQIVETLMRHRLLSHSEATEEAIRLFEKVRIPSARMRIHEYPHQFSGGMRQRVMIAMALACKPRVLIADEPTTALDVTIQAQILQLLKELQEEEGMSVLFITHDMGVVAEIADRSVVMYDGRIVEIGDTVDIFERPAKGYTQALLSSVPKLGSMAGIDQPMRFPSIDRATGRMQPPAPLEHTARFAERPLLEVKGLTKRFEIRKGLFSTVTGRVHAIENVSFNLHKGETLALVGESGCGKSTTGRAILRLTSLDSGSILMGDQDISRMEGDALRAARKRMQIIFQDPFASLNPRIPVGLAVCEPLLAHGMITRGKIRDRAATLLESVGLDGAMATRYPHEFSGGQRQRICIARAMALEPDLIIADESVSALDVSVKAQVINLMLDLQEKMGLSYLFISHDIAVVERMAHRIAVMFLGEIVEIGPRAAVLGSPQHPYTKKLISAVPSPDPARRHGRRATSDDELISPIRPADYVVPSRSYREVSPGHLVQE